MTGESPLLANMDSQYLGSPDFDTNNLPRDGVHAIKKKRFGFSYSDMVDNAAVSRPVPLSRSNLDLFSQKSADKLPQSLAQQKRGADRNSL